MSEVLVVAPHPDDEVIGCGGAIVKHVRRGNRVRIVVVVEREPSFHDVGVTKSEFDAELESAALALGAYESIHLEAPSRDLRLDRALVIRLASLIRQQRPEVVYVPHPHESDAEHMAVHDLTMQAVWMASEPFFPEAGTEPAPLPSVVLGYEVWTPLDQFQYVEDITSVLHVKLTALRCYRSQLRIRPYDAMAEGLAAYRGVMARGGGAAEVFSVLRVGEDALSFPPATSPSN